MVQTNKLSSLFLQTILISASSVPFCSFLAFLFLAFCMPLDLASVKLQRQHSLFKFPQQQLKETKITIGLTKVK